MQSFSNLPVKYTCASWVAVKARAKARAAHRRAWFTKCTLNALKQESDC